MLRSITYIFPAPSLYIGIARCAPQRRPKNSDQQGLLRHSHMCFHKGSLTLLILPSPRNIGILLEHGDDYQIGHDSCRPGSTP